MPTKRVKSRSSGVRQTIVIDYKKVLTTTSPEKSLLVSLSKNAGRNNQGKITVRHHGGGVKQKYRIVDFKRDKINKVATVKTI